MLKRSCWHFRFFYEVRSWISTFPVAHILYQSLRSFYVAVYVLTLWHAEILLLSESRKISKVSSVYGDDRPYKSPQALNMEVWPWPQILWSFSSWPWLINDRHFELLDLQEIFVSEVKNRGSALHCCLMKVNQNAWVWNGKIFSCAPHGEMFITWTGVQESLKGHVSSPGLQRESFRRTFRRRRVVLLHLICWQCGNKAFSRGERRTNPNALYANGIIGRVLMPQYGFTRK